MFLCHATGRVVSKTTGCSVPSWKARYNALRKINMTWKVTGTHPHAMLMGCPRLVMNSGFLHTTSHRPFAHLDSTIRFVTSHCRLMIRTTSSSRGLPAQWFRPTSHICLRIQNKQGKQHVHMIRHKSKVERSNIGLEFEIWRGWPKFKIF